MSGGFQCGNAGADKVFPKGSRSAKRAVQPYSLARSFVQAWQETRPVPGRFELTASSTRLSGEAKILRDRIWRLVARIPPGRVMTYGEIAHAVGLRHGAQQVGWAMRRCPAQLDLPWHRVLAAGGRIALPGDRGEEQRLRLLYENVPFAGNRVRLDRCRWEITEP